MKDEVRQLKDIIEELFWYIQTEDGDPILGMMDAQYNDGELPEYEHVSGFRFFLAPVVPDFLITKMAKVLSFDY